MNGFAALLERLRFCPTLAHRQAVLAAYVAAVPDSALALEILSGARIVRPVGRGVLRDLAGRIDPALFALSMAFVGDYTETLALIWPAGARNQAPPELIEILAASKAEIQDRLPAWLDASDARTRLALLRLCSGKFRPLPALFTALAATPFRLRSVNAVLMYMQSIRIGLQREYRFGVWHGGALVPIAGITEIAEDLRDGLEAWVRDNTINKFGPVREVGPGLVAELAFAGVRTSPRHKAGLVLHAARLVQLRPDIAASDADQLIALAGGNDASRDDKSTVMPLL